MRNIYFLLAAFVVSNFSFGQSACLSSLNDFAFVGPTNGSCIEQGDFDGDGNLDLVIANFTIGTLKVNLLKGNGDATFDAPVTVEGGTRPSSLRAGDFNGDGDLDLLVANFSPANISLLFGNGDGTFAAAVNYTPNTGPRGLDVGDLNGDGLLDFVVGCNAGGVNVFLNTMATPGTFTSGGYFTMAAATYGVKIADYNNDGMQDVAAANEGGGNVSIRFGNGAGSLGAATNYITAAGSYEIDAADFNGDGLQDIAVSNRIANSMSVLLNMGAGIFGTATSYAAGSSPYGIDIADLDLDGDQDILVVNGGSNTLSVFKGSTGGTFLAQVQSNLIGNPRDLVIGAFNSGSNPDIGICTFVGQVMTVLPGNGTLSYADDRTFSSAGAPTSLAIADFNGNSDNDLVIASFSDNTVKYYSGDGLGYFGTGTSFAVGTGPRAIAVGDVNNNGTLDAVTANATAGTISVLLGNGAGGFPTVTSFACGTDPTDVTLADVNNDGNLDVLVVNTSVNQFSVLLGTGVGSFGAPTTYATGVGPTAILAKNLNTGGFVDIVITNGGATTISVFLNSGTGTFPTAVTSTVQSAPSDVDGADIDNDGDIDLVVSNFTNSSISRLLNNGSGVFGTAVNTTLTAGEATSVKLADFNNDGNQDAAVAFRMSSASTGIVGIFMGNGAGVFTYYNKFSTGIGPEELAVGSLSDDGRIDAVVVNEAANSYTVLRNNTAQITASGPLSFCSPSGVNLTSTASTLYDWSPSGTTQMINAVASGNYFVTTTQGPSFWCESTSNTLTVTNAAPAAPTVTASGSTTLCSGGSVILTSSYATGNTWSTGQTTQSITVSATGNYTVTHTAMGCTSAPSTPISVIVNSTPTITASGPTTFCTGGSVVLTSSIASPILWSNGATTPSITISSTGSYTVATNFPSCAPLTSAPTSVTVNTYPATPTITASGPTTFCNGGSVTLTSSSGTNNVWSNSSTNNTLVANTAGSYFVTVNNAGCISSPSNTINVTVNSNPSAPTITNGATASFCQGSSLVLNSSLASNNVWSTGATSQSLTVNTAGTYTVSQVNGFGCTSTPASIVVTQNSLPSTPTVTANGPLTFCAGGSVVLTSSYTTNNAWTPSGTGQNLTVTTSGTYAVQHTNANGCVSLSSTPINVIVNTNPSAPTVTAIGPTSFCPGGSVNLQSSATSGNMWNNFATTQTITATTTGNYSTIFTDGNGCTSPSSNSILVTLLSAPPTPTITASGPLNFCSGGSVDLTSSETTDILWSTGSSTPTITVTSSGVFNVTKTGANGCTSTSASTTVNVSSPPLAPTISANGPTSFCSGESVILTSSAPQNLWSNGSTAPSITVTSAGQYYVNSSANGCLSAATSDTIEVSIIPTPPAPTISANGPTTFCEGDSVQLSSSQNNLEEWSNGMTGQQVWISESGILTVTSSIVGGCASTSNPITIVVNPSPSITLQNDPTYCISSSAIALTLATPAGGNYSGNGIIANLLFPNLAGIGTHGYTYSVTNSLGCTGTAMGNIIVDDCVAIEENNLETIRLFPNPSNGKFTLTSDQFSIEHLTILDNLGKIVKVYNFIPSKTIQIDETQIESGVYQVLIEHEGFEFRIPIVIQH